MQGVPLIFAKKACHGYKSPQIAEKYRKKAKEKLVMGIHEIAWFMLKIINTNGTVSIDTNYGNRYMSDGDSTLDALGLIIGEGENLRERLLNTVTNDILKNLGNIIAKQEIQRNH